MPGGGRSVLCSYYIAHVCGPVYDVSCLYHMLSSLVFSILHVVVLEKLWTFVLGTKQSVRIASAQIHSFGSCIYLVHFNVCRKPEQKFGFIKPVDKG